MLGVLVLSTVPGSYLIYQGGIPLLVGGVLSVLACLGYSGGPVPYASFALGDLMVFLFFGVVATTGTFYVQFCETLAPAFPTVPPSNSLPSVSWVVAVPPGALSTCILIINNLRDREEDRRAGKYTMAVLLVPYWKSFSCFRWLISFPSGSG